VRVGERINSRDLQREEGGAARVGERDNRMLPSKKATSAAAAAVSSNDRQMCVQGDSGLVLTTDPKPRLRWTVELHERFVDAVAQLGGPDSAFPFLAAPCNGFHELVLDACVCSCCRGDAQDHHEGYGSEGAYSLPSQEPPPGVYVCSCTS
jgi:hypothetical protein